MKQIACVLITLITIVGCAHKPAVAENGAGRVDAMDLPMQVAQHAGPGRVPVSISPDGRCVLSTDDQGAGLFFSDTETSSTTVITRALNSGFYATLSPDARFIGFKAFKADRDDFQQAAIVYDRKLGRASNLTGWVHTASTPAFSPKSDAAAFVANGTLTVVDTVQGKWSRHDIGATPNILRFSPDGNSIVYANDAEQLSVINIHTWVGGDVTSDTNSYYAGEFSPDGRHIAGRTINAKIVAVDPRTKSSKILGDGEDPQWLDNSTVLYVEWEGKLRTRRIDSDGKAKNLGVIGNRWWALNGRQIVSRKGDLLQLAELAPDGLRNGKSIKQAPDEDPPVVKPKVYPADMKAAQQPATTTLTETDQLMRVDGVPYLNQMYDLGDEFPGQWACNATCAVMLLAYHNAVPPHPMEVSKPEKRDTPYGYYIAHSFTNNGTTFDTTSPGPEGEPVSGGYGYIVRNSWKDTKHYMRDFFRLQGLRSETDWSPTFAKAVDQIKQKQPFVLLNSITLSGHYVACIGFVKDHRTLIFNDPYGNKNSRVYPSMDGRNVKYDIPGYNNGYQTLRIVHCYVYAADKNTTGTMPMPGEMQGNPGV